MTPAPVPGTAAVPTARLLLLLLLLVSAIMASPLLNLPRPPPQPPSFGGTALHQDYYDEEDEGPSPGDTPSQAGDSNDHLDEDEYSDIANSTEAVGSVMGGPCFNSCSETLRNAFCSAATQRCECDPLHPVNLGATRGCTSPVSLGDQCLYQAACQHWEPHARCTQVEHNAVCQCEPGFHTVSAYKPHRRSFCSEDLVLLTSDLPTLLGVATGIALFTGVICFVLRLFVGGRPRDHFANANLAPSHILFSSETGLPLTGQVSSRAGSQRSMSLSRGVLVPGMSSSRAGSRRQSVASVHSSASSSKSLSFGMRRFEREREQRLRRQEQQLQLQERQSQLQTPGSACSSSASPAASPSNPLSPMSTDKLLPALDQLVEDVVWTTQSSSQRPDHLIATAGSSGYRRERAEQVRSERARQLQAMHAHLAGLHAAHAAHASSQAHQAQTPCTSPDGR